MAMLLIAGAILAGILAGLVLGGSIRQLAEIHLRWWPLALVGLALQLAPIPSMKGQMDHWLAVGLLIASYVVLLAFVVVNIRLPGFWLIAAGFALNVLVISINAGMPVSREALRQAYGGPDYQVILRDLEFNGGAKHHLSRPDDVLLPLSDVIPLGRPVRLVLSVGDVMFFLGVTWVIAAATKGPPGRHRVGSGTGSGRNLEPEADGVRPEPAEHPQAPQARAQPPPG